MRGSEPAKTRILIRRKKEKRETERRGGDGLEAQLGEEPLVLPLGIALLEQGLDRLARLLPARRPIDSTTSKSGGVWLGGSEVSCASPSHRQTFRGWSTAACTA